MGPCGLFRRYRPICTWGFTYLVELFGNMGSTLRWFNDDDIQPEFTVLYMPTIILEYTA